MVRLELLKQGKFSKAMVIEAKSVNFDLMGDQIGEAVSGLIPNEVPYVCEDAPKLSRAETKVFHLMANGRSNDEIALELSKSTQTIKNQLHNIYCKFGINGKKHSGLDKRIFAIHAGIALGLIDFESDIAEENM